MAVEWVVGLGIAVTRLLLRVNDPTSETADVAGDVDDLWSKLRGLRRHPDAVTKTITATLKGQLTSDLSVEDDQEIRAAATEVVALFTELANSREAVADAAAHPDQFLVYARRHGGDSRREQLGQRAEAAFDRILQAACDQFAQLVPSSPMFLPAMFDELGGRIHDLHEEVQRVGGTIQDAADHSREAASYSRRAVELLEAADQVSPPHQTTPGEAPGLGALATANAMMQGPLSSSGAQHHVDAAKAEEESDPQKALTCLRAAQALLVEARFPAHAEVLDADVVTLLVRLERADEATRLLLDRFWVAVRDDLNMTAQLIARDLAGDERTGTGTTLLNHSPIGVAAGQIAQAAVRANSHPFDELPVVDQEAVEPALPLDQARLLLLYTEIALASGQYSWLEIHLQAVTAAAGAVGKQDIELQARLQLVAADTTGAWTELLRNARRRLPTQALAALSFARNARYRAIRGDYQEADDAWLDAVDHACQAERHEDAMNWLHSRRRLAGRYSAEFEDPIFPLVDALRRRPTHPPIAAAHAHVHEWALDALQRGKLPEASRRLRRYLRDAVVSGAWQDEHDARSLLANLYRDAGEPGWAANHLVLAGEAKRAEQLGRQVGDNYLDVLQHLGSPMYWVHATALRLIAAQADLLPDGAVTKVADNAFGVLGRAMEGTLVDTPLFDPSLYLAAHKALAALAGRLTFSQAEKLLNHLAPLAPGTKHAGRHTDDDHAAACAAIGATYPDLLGPALDQLLDLLARAGHALKRPARDLLIEQAPRVWDQLAEIAARGNGVAEEIVALAEPEALTEERAEVAYQALSAPLDSRQGVYAIGTNAIGHSHAAARLPAERRAELIRDQLERARSPYENPSNRIEYLLGAANLADDLPLPDVDALFELAIAEAAQPAASEPELLDAGLRHPLGSFRIISGNKDSRPAAAFLAARLAATPDQRQQARHAALRLIGADGDADYHVTRALQVLRDGLERDVPFLSKQGWALRCLAAQTWARTPALPSALGDALASDSDVRVRRTLAQELASSIPDERTADARRRLSIDSRHSVRSLLQSQ